MRFVSVLPVLMALTLLGSASCDGVIEEASDDGSNAGEGGFNEGGGSGGGAPGAGASGGAAPDAGVRDGGALDGGVRDAGMNVSDSGIAIDETDSRSSAAVSWLSEHNSRRQRYHQLYGGSYVPLKWSTALAVSSRAYAEEMARTGVWAHSSVDYP
jgi:hypothetical protein